MHARRKLGSVRTLASNLTLYEIEGGVEMESRETIDLIRTRVFWEDVLMVTHHRCVPLTQTLVLGVATTVLAGIAALTALGSLAAAAVVGVIALLPGIPLAACLVLRVDVVTVFGRRSRVRAHYILNKQRGRQVFDDICARARRSHRELEAMRAAEAPPPADEGFLLPPPAGTVEPAAADEGASPPPIPPHD